MAYEGHPSIYRCRLCGVTTNDPALHVDDEHPDKFEGQPLAALLSYFTLVFLGRAKRERLARKEIDGQGTVDEAIVLLQEQALP